jgi:hypothetical protein
VTETADPGNAGKPDPGQAATPAELVEALRRLKRWTGVGYRQLAKRAAVAGQALPRSTLTVALNRSTLPREDLIAAFVRTCGCDEAEVAAWVAARRRIAAATSPTGPAPRWLGHRRPAVAGGPGRADAGDEDGQPAETLELVNAELAQRQAGQTAAAAAVQTRALLLLGFAAVAAQFLATRDGEPVLQLGAFTAYAVSAAAGLAALAVRPSPPGPTVDALLQEYAGQPRDDALARLAAARAVALREDAARQRRRTQWWWVALIALTVATVLSILVIRHAAA